MKQILKARKRIAMFTLAKSSGIDDAMIALRKAKRPISGVLDNRQANQKWAPTKSLKKAGVKLFVAKTKNEETRRAFVAAQKKLA